jgi:hypothetical protein
MKSSIYQQWETKPDDMSVEAWREKYGVPDWRDAKAYPRKLPKGAIPPPGHRELSRDQWRWEFLRRITDYHDSWEYFEDGATSYQLATPENLSDLAEEDFHTLDDPKYFALNIFDLSHIIDPRTQAHDLPETFFCRRYGGRRITSGHVSELDKLLGQERLELFVFDIFRPLDEQIARAKGKLRLLQRSAAANAKNQAISKGKTRFRRGTDGNIQDVILNQRLSDHPNELLQVLDAHNENVSLRTIGIEVLGHLEDDYKKASDHAAEALNIALHMWEWL